MRILLAKDSGFCFGVRRAVDLALRTARERGTVYSYGAIIHNETVVAELARNGVVPIDSLSDLRAGDTLIIRAHGAPPEVYAACEKKGVAVVDATCPFVKRIHGIAQKESARGKTILIAGKSDHPEVVGIRGWAGDNAVVLETPEDTKKLQKADNGAIVAQTTLSQQQYQVLCDAAKPYFSHLEVFATICDTTRARQSEAAIISDRCNKVLVIGSVNSANTVRLSEICKKRCQDTKTIENIDKLFLDNLQTNDIIGVVAGASTPDRMIREVLQVMSELEKTTIETIEAEAPAEEIAVTQEPAANEAVAAAPSVEEMPAKEADAEDSFAEAFEKTMTRIRNGQIINGTVLQVVDGEVFVNIGYKSDGFIPKNEFSSDSDVKPEDVVKEGDTIDVEVLKVNDGEGNVLLSRKSVEGKKLWDDLVSQEDIEGKVFDAVGKEVVKGGVIADINGIRAFVPASQVSTKYIENLAEYVGKPMKLKVLEVDKQRKRIVASQKQVLLAEAEADKKAKWEALVVGSKVQGVVRRITDFGAFVDIGGIDGLVHVTDAGWGRVKHPSDVFTIGQEIEVLILGVDLEKQRVSLGYKQLQPKPWTTADQRYPVGSIVEGKVVRIVPFGAFVSLESTIDGLIHISQIAERRIEKVEDAVKVGDVVRCKVLEVNTEAKRISLSRKEAILEEHPEIAEQLAAEKAERDRQYAERQEQRQQSRDQQTQQRKERSSSGAPSAPRSTDSYEQRERSYDRRRRNNEDGDYELPPVQSATTSLADLFKDFNADN